MHAYIVSSSATQQSYEVVTENLIKEFNLSLHSVH